MINDEQFAFFEKSYWMELQFRGTIERRLANPLFVLSAVVAYLVYQAENQTMCDWEWHLLVLFVISASSALVSGCYIARAFYGQPYEMLPSSEKLHNYIEELNSTYEEFDEKDQLVSRYRTEALYNYYVRCSTHNNLNNLKKSKWLHLSLRYLMLSLLFAFMFAVDSVLLKNI